MSSRFTASADRPIAWPAACFVAIMACVYSFTSTAQAQVGASGGGNQMLQFVPIVFAFVVMIVFSNYKQKKTRTEREAFLTKLERGEEVITSGGLLGRIEGLTDLYLTLEIAPGTRIKVLRSAVAGLAKNVSGAPSEVKA